jgi:translation initiation factor 3 subunit C
MEAQYFFVSNQPSLIDVVFTHSCFVLFVFCFCFCFLYILFQGSDSRAKTRALLCQVYNLALEEQFFEARDLFLMYHLQDTITGADIATQILFNRTMVQLGLCAFRHGLIIEAHSCLADLYGSGKVKELLAQGVTTSRFTEKTPEQEKLAKLRQIPYHMHINLELIDSIHLISAMLLDIPNMAMTSSDKKKGISKHFRRLLDHHDKQVFNGPPENTHDFIMAASHALSKGDVDRCCDLLLGLKVSR